MGASTLGAAGVRAMLRRELEAETGAAWLDAITGPVLPSDSPTETYPFIGQTPALREWIGGRQSNDFRENSISVTNDHYEATINILVSELRRDKTGLLRARISELAQRAATHWASIVSTLIVAGESATCYDGQYFFDTDHSEGDSGTQSNDLSVDISALPAVGHGSTTAPSPEEVQQALSQAISAIAGFVDDKGEPMNETASQFVVMSGTGLSHSIRNGLAMPMTAGVTAQSDMGGFSVAQATNVRLNAWTTKFVVFRTDSPTKAIYRQQDGMVGIKGKAEGSDFEFDYDAHQYGVDVWRQAFYGYWQNACLVTLA